ncbi:MAG: TIGR00266 family protein [Planctomycetales bacterium]|nr:TIGR00266 family protein [Planctomycetales bacterium]
MEYRINHGPVFSVLEIDLDADEAVVAQPNSMLSMTGGIGLSAAIGRRGAGSGVWSGFKSLLGGENFFTAEFAAKKPGQRLILAPESHGDILSLDLAHTTGFYLTRGSYLANVGECDLKIKYGGIKGVMSKKGLFLLHASGTGTVFCQCFGAVIAHELGEGERFFVDNRFVVAFTDTVQYQLVKATESVKDSLMSGEGLVNRYTGPGMLYYQTRGKPSAGLLTRLFDAAF